MLLYCELFRKTSNDKLLSGSFSFFHVVIYRNGIIHFQCLYCVHYAHYTALPHSIPSALLPSEASFGIDNISASILIHNNSLTEMMTSPVCYYKVLVTVLIHLEPFFLCFQDTALSSFPSTL